ncbi:MAG TPA: amino acid ABC transporter substrate-binding protein [Pirellulales bacterium]|jgi:glutamate/aspartate transport system substrate-binding protein|nr:amino acid ABC transporter substrate-binding protein [Pirellulales bacterium]
MLIVRICFLLLLLAGLYEPARAQEGRLAAIMSAKTIKIAYRTDARPFSYTNSFNDPAGYTIDLCRMLVDVMQQRLKLDALKIEWVPVSTQQRFEAVGAGKADIECGASTVTLSRMEQVDFSSLIFVETTGILVKKDSAISTSNDLAGKKIAVISGTTNEAAIRNAFDSKRVTIVSVKSREEGVALLERGAADAFASDKLLLVGAQFQNAQALTMLPDDISLERYALALPRGDSSLRLAVNGALARIFRSGEVLKIYERWFTPVGLRPGPLMNAVFLLGALPD